MLKKIPRAFIYWNWNTFLTGLRAIYSFKILEGPSLQLFSKKLKEYLRVKHVVFTPSGKISLYLILHALNIDEGDEILVPAYTVPEVVEVILGLGVKPVFVDISEDLFNPAPRDFEAAITPNTKAILMTHMYGCPSNIQEITKIAEKNNLFIVEDAAQAIGAEYAGKKIGNFGKASYFSFGAMKHFNTLGGSIVATDDTRIYEYITKQVNKFRWPSSFRLIKLFVKTTAFKIALTPFMFSLCIYPLIYIMRVCFGRLLYKILAGRPVEEEFPKDFIEKEKTRFTNLQAAIGLEQMKRLDVLNEKRMKNAETIDAMLNIERKREGEPPLKDIRTQYVLLFQDRDSVSKKLFANGIDTTNGYLENCSLRYSENTSEDSCPNSTKASLQNLYIPINPNLTKKDLSCILNALQELL